MLKFCILLFVIFLLGAEAVALQWLKRWSEVLQTVFCDCSDPELYNCVLFWKSSSAGHILSHCAWHGGVRGQPWFHQTYRRVAALHNVCTSQIIEQVVAPTDSFSFLLVLMGCLVNYISWSARWMQRVFLTDTASLQSRVGLCSGKLSKRGSMLCQVKGLSEYR